MDKQAIDEMLATATKGSSGGGGPYTAALNFGGYPVTVLVSSAAQFESLAVRDELLRRIQECPPQDWRDTASPENPVWCWVSNANSAPNMRDLMQGVGVYNPDISQPYWSRGGFWKYATPCTEEELALLKLAREKLG